MLLGRCDDRKGREGCVEMFGCVGGVELNLWLSIVIQSYKGIHSIPEGIS